jgi:hypothetical protein
VSESEGCNVDVERALIEACEALREVCEAQQCSVDAKRALGEVCETLREAHEHVYAILGFMAAESMSKRFIDGLCDMLFEVHGMEPPAKDSDRAKYLSECLKLSLKEKEVRDLFYWYGLLYHHYAMRLIVSVLSLEDNPIEH